MYELVDNPFVNKQMNSEVAEILAAQERAQALGGFLVSEYDKYFLPRLAELKGVKRGTYRPNYNNGLLYNWICEFGTVKALPDAPYGTATLVPFPGAQLPEELKDAKAWTLAQAELDYSTRTITIKNDETVITFPSIDIGLAGWQLNRDINEQLQNQNAGVIVWKITGVVSDPAVQHLYEDGRIPTIRNEHAQGNVTGFAVTDSSWNSTLVYAGVVAHKTAIESLHATLLQRKGLSLDGNQAVPDGHFRLEVAPLPDFNLFHAALICDAALPGQWSPLDEKAYALVFRQSNGDQLDKDSQLESALLARLREVLPHPVKDEWAHELFTRGLEKDLIERLRTGGDCLDGVCINLDKDWTTMLGDMLTENLLIV
jgi:hypothetical protein